MTPVHAKSPCCNARVVRFGSRRRLCTQCHQTWRIRRKRRGRKRTRPHPHAALRRFEAGTSLRHAAQQLRMTREQLRRRQAAAMELLLHTLPRPALPAGRLIAVIDGLRLHLEGSEWTFYLVLLRGVRSKRAVLLEPLLLKGRESLRGWVSVFGNLPPDIPQRIVAFVSDSLTKIEYLAETRGWIHQRCHVHLLRELQRFRGKRMRKYAVERPLRGCIYRTICEILRSPSEYLVRRRVHRLCSLLAREDCPRWLRSRGHGLLNHLAAFRAYRRFPHLHLPTTTNAAESAVGLLRELLARTRGFRTACACKRWVSLFIRTHPFITCNGYADQPN